MNLHEKIEPRAGNVENWSSASEIRRSDSNEQQIRLHTAGFPHDTSNILESDSHSIAICRNFRFLSFPHNKCNFLGTYFLQKPEPFSQIRSWTPDADHVVGLDWLADNDCLEFGHYTICYRSLCSKHVFFNYWLNKKASTNQP